MRVTRRNFLRVAAIGAGSIAFAGCDVPDKELWVQSPILPPEDLLTGFDSWYATTAHQCASGCGIIVRVFEGRAKKVEGNPDHPISQGKSCLRCQAAVQGVYHPDRIRTPMKRTGERGSGQYQPISWDQAYQEAVAKLREVQGRNNAVLLARNEWSLDGMALSRFARALGAEPLGYEGIEQTVLREAMFRVYGQERLPDFDIQNARTVLSFGADFLHTWLSPVQYGRDYGAFRQGGGQRGTLIAIEPQRLSSSAASADEWVPVNPGSEGILAYSMAQVIAAERLGDSAVAAALGSGLSAYAPEQVASIVGLTADRIKELAHSFANNKPALALPGATIAGHSNGLFNVVAVLTLNRLVGRNDLGGVRFNPAPPLPSLAAAPLRVATFNDWIRLAHRMAGGQVQLAIVAGANPVYSLPAAVNMREAFAKVPFVISFSTMLDETTAMADLILPSHHPLENWGISVPDPGPGYQVLSLQQPVINPVFSTQPLGDILVKLATDLGGAVKQAIPWASARELVRESVQQLFDANQASTPRGSVRAPDFDAFWIGVLQRGGWWDTVQAGSAPAAGLPAVTPPPGPERAIIDGAPGAYPYNLVVFESNALGAGEGASLPWLQAVPDPITSASWQAWVEVSHRTAEELGVHTGDMVLVKSTVWAIEAPVYVSPAISHSVVAMPTGQGHSVYGRYAAGRGSNVLSVLAPMVDGATGALAWSATRVQLEKTGRTYDLALYEGVKEPTLHDGLEIYPLSKV